MTGIESKILKNYSLRNHTTWLVGGAADFAFFPETVEEVGEAMVWARQKQLPLTILGHGSNVLISDQGIEGLVLIMQKLSGFTVHEKDKQFFLDALAGTAKSDVLKFFLKERLSPAVFLAGLPGDLGGGVVMNAGVSTDTSPKEFVSIVKQITVASLKEDGSSYVLKDFSSEQIKWSYRKSEGWQPGVIVKVQLAWERSPDDSVLVKVREGNARRKATQPLNQPSCGSVFKNPEGERAGRLIEQSGLKGFRIGEAMISDKHANFIVNLGMASAKDIDSLIKLAKNTVKDRFGSDLTAEVKYLGRW